MKKFTNLKCLVLNDNQAAPTPPINHQLQLVMKSARTNFTSPVIVRFLFYLWELPICSVRNLQFNNNVGDILEEYFELLPTNEAKNMSITCRIKQLNRREIIKVTIMSIDRLLHLLYLCLLRLVSLLFLIPWSKTGRFLTVLGLNFRQIADPIQELNEQDYKTATGYFLNHVFQYCSTLNLLILEHHKLIRCNPDEIYISKSITRLHVKHTGIYKKVFTELSVRFRSLESLQLIDCSFIGSDESVIIGRHMEIDMPYTVFNSLEIRSPVISTQVPYSRIRIKLSTLAGEKIYKIKGKEKKDGLDNDSLSDSRYAEIHINCKSIKRIYITGMNGIKRKLIVNR